MKPKTNGRHTRTYYTYCMHIRMHIYSYPYESINTIRSVTCEFSIRICIHTQKTYILKIYKKYKRHMRVYKLRLWFDVVC